MDYQSELRRLLEEAIEGKDATALGTLLYNIEVEVEEDIFDAGPMEDLFDLKDVIGSEQLVQEFRELLLQYGVCVNSTEAFDSFSDLMDEVLFNCVEPENIVLFYRAAAALLLNHPETGVLNDGGKAFTDDILDFAESNAGDEIFERIIETQNEE